MLREEVLTKWNSCKTKLATVCLTPKEKEIWKFLERSKVVGFSIIEHSLRPLDLNQLEKEIKAEKLRDIPDDTENDLLIDYWFCWNNLATLILDWIRLGQTLSFFRDENKKIEQEFENKNSRIETFEGIKSKITNFSEVSRAYHRDEPTTFYAVARSEWPKVFIWGEWVDFPKLIRAIPSIEASVEQSEFGRKNFEMIKAVEEKWNQEILPKIEKAFY